MSAPYSYPVYYSQSYKRWHRPRSPHTFVNLSPFHILPLFYPPSLILYLFNPHAGEPSVSRCAASQTLIIIGHEVVVITAPWEKFMIILCSHLPISPMTLPIAFCYCSRADTFPELCLYDNGSGLRGNFYYITRFNSEFLTIHRIDLY